jgi:hypothetical protein
MLEWDRCEACGARRSPDAEWCGQCYAPVNRAGDVAMPDEGSPPPASPTTGPGRDGLELVEVRSDPGEEVAPDAFLVLRHEEPVVTRETRAIVTGAVVAVGTVTDLLFFPHFGFMLAYGAFVASLGWFVLRKMWKGAAPSGSRDDFIRP